MFWNVASIGVGAGKFLGGRRIFAQISANLSEKNPNKMTSKKRLHFTGRKALQTPFLPKYHPSLPKFLHFPKKN